MFDVGDEVVCVDDSPYRDGVPFGVTRGERFTVLRSIPEGSVLYSDAGITVTSDDATIAIGRNNIALREWWKRTGRPEVLLLDVWLPERFRKVERKRSREELYALIGIRVDQTGGARVPELV